MGESHGVNALLRLPEVVRLTGRSKYAVYADIRAGLFTRPVPLGSHSVAWPASEVAAINQARIAGLKLVELQALVVELHALRLPPAIMRKRPEGRP